ncbi:inositol phosphorylceramide glucuronosyltransferase 1 [Cucumis melo var. makuwa]|uniref:Inositol phosphorylceramide glucuronosyltransferase 1 n=1 Tax=Cucumis melo var. makuwa TaxID=1194695 RepID=A0A5D3DUQ8_CUCMM|nr:inositol phosphorylceramide glucuronosyltransferase 1 [Cucumis melo var. makuwa]
MKPIAWIFLPFALVLIQSLLSAASSSSSSGSQSSDEAYVTLLYGDEFLLGVRVLGKSIRDTGSSKDMVALISDGVSEYAKRLLEVYLSSLALSLPDRCGHVK